jgi:hypothetical protein
MKLAALLGALACSGGIGPGLPGLGRRRLDHECVQCHKPIPPGRQGRKCKDCRPGMDAAMTEQQAAAIIREFLADHPEHIQGVKQAEVPDEPEPVTVMDTEALIAFADWTLRTGRGDPAKARAFREQLREKFGK